MIETTSKARLDRMREALEHTAHALGIGDCSGWDDGMLCFAVLYRSGAIPSGVVGMGV